MKGFNVKKLAAIAAGAALLGAAIAPAVSATSVTQQDVYSANGSPKVNIVIGSGAALSDAVWAGNLAAKIAEKAVQTKQVSVSATGAGGGSISDIDLSDLTIDITVGGNVTFGAGTKTYNVTLSSTANASEIIAALNGTDDVNALTEAQLPHLYNDTITQRVTNGDQSNVRTSLTVQEKIGINVDAKFDTSSDVKDLVGIIGADDFSYITTTGSAATGVDLGSTSFTDDSGDDVKIVFFGEEYELSQATLTGTKYVKLVKASARESFNEGETIEGLVGNNEFDGQEVTVKVVQIIQTGTAVSTYQATFKLYDAEGNLIDTRTVSTAENLKDVFKDSEQDEALASNLYIDTIAIGSTTGIGYVEVTKGTDTVELYDGGVYPYDSSHTGTKKYVARIAAGTSDANSLYSIEIENSGEIWEDPDSGNFDLGPLYPTRSGQSLTGTEGTTAEFLGTMPEGTQGKGYAKVEFLGFEGDEEKTIVEFGKGVTGLPSQSSGGISFRADDDSPRNIPFYLKLNDTNSSFEFEGKTVSYNMDFGTSGKSGTADAGVNLVTADIINGRAWAFTTTGGGAGLYLLTIAGNGTYYDVNDSDTISVDGTTFTITDANVSGAAAHTMRISSDAIVDFRQGESDSSTYVYNIAGATTDESYGKLMLTNSSTFDGNTTTIGLYGSEAARRVYYAAQYNGSDLWMLLDADNFGAGQSDVIQNSHAVYFLGTSVPADDGTHTEVAGLTTTFRDGIAATQIQSPSATTMWYGHYVPQDTDFNAATVFGSSDGFFVAEFGVNSAVDGSDFNVYIDTEDGSMIGPHSQDNLASYSNDVKYLGTNSWNLTSGTTSTYLHAGYTDAGTKAWLVDGSASGVKFSMPQTAEKVDIVVYGAEVTREVEGGEALTLAPGESGTTDSGIQVTWEAYDGGSCGIAGSGAVVCSANPTSYDAAAAVRNPIVYLDNEAPNGTNIIIGGQIVNKLASGLADRLTAPGQMVAEVDAASGDIYLAGYTAQDTAKAVKELIDEIEAW